MKRMLLVCKEASAAHHFYVLGISDGTGDKRHVEVISASKDAPSLSPFEWNLVADGEVEYGAMKQLKGEVYSAHLADTPGGFINRDDLKPEKYYVVEGRAIRGGDPDYDVMDKVCAGPLEDWNKAQDIATRFSEHHPGLKNADVWRSPAKLNA